MIQKGQIDKQKIDYKQVVREYLSEVSGAPIKEDPEVPIFFVDYYPDEVLFT